VDVVAAFVADAQPPVLVQPSDPCARRPSVWCRGPIRAPSSAKRSSPGCGGGANWLRPSREWYARSPHKLRGRRRGRPRRPRTVGIASRSGISWVMSLRLPPVSEQASGVPRPQVITWCLEPLLERSAGLGPGLSPPKARTCELSIAARDQSVRSASFRFANSSSCSRCQTPASCHSRNRRQQVIPEPQTISRGRYSHGIPVRSTNKIPLQHLAVIEPLATRIAVAPRHPRDQRLDQVPQLVGDQRPRHLRPILSLAVDAAAFAAGTWVPAPRHCRFLHHDTVLGKIRAR
jgi:hypothetical protein